MDLLAITSPSPNVQKAGTNETVDPDLTTLEDNIFASFIADDELIPLNNEEVYRLYALLTYERIQRCRSNNESQITKEVVTSQIQTRKTTVIILSPTASQPKELEFPDKEIKRFETIRTTYGEYTMPEADVLDKWDDVLDTLTRILEQHADDIASLLKPSEPLTKILAK